MITAILQLSDTSKTHITLPFSDWWIYDGTYLVLIFEDFLAYVAHHRGLQLCTGFL